MDACGSTHLSDGGDALLPSTRLPTQIASTQPQISGWGRFDLKGSARHDWTSRTIEQPSCRPHRHAPMMEGSGTHGPLVRKLRGHAPRAARWLGRLGNCRDKKPRDASPYRCSSPKLRDDVLRHALLRRGGRNQLRNNELYFLPRQECTASRCILCTGAVRRTGAVQQNC